MAFRTDLKTMSSDVPVTLHSFQESLHWQVFQSVMLLASSLVVQRSAMEEAFHRFIIHYNRSVGETREDGRHNLGPNGSQTSNLISKKITLKDM